MLNKQKTKTIKSQPNKRLNDDSWNNTGHSIPKVPFERLCSCKFTAEVNEIDTNRYSCPYWEIRPLFLTHSLRCRTALENLGLVFPSTDLSRPLHAKWIT